MIGAAWDKDTREGRERMPICGSFGIRLDFGENIPHSPDNLRWNYDLQAEVAAATGKFRNRLCLWLGSLIPA